MAPGGVEKLCSVKCSQSFRWKTQRSWEVRHRAGTRRAHATADVIAVHVRRDHEGDVVGIDSLGPEGIEEDTIAIWPQSPFAYAAVDQDQTVLAADKKAENPGLHLVCCGIGIGLSPPLVGGGQRDEAGGRVAPCGVLNRDDFDATDSRWCGSKPASRTACQMGGTPDISSTRPEVRNCRLGRSWADNPASVVRTQCGG